MFSWKTDTTRVPTYESLPTEPYINCDWDDGTITSNQLFELNENNNVADDNSLYIFNVEHDYQTHGVYDIECAMNNKVSVQSLNHQVCVEIDIFIILLSTYNEKINPLLSIIKT